MGQKQGYKKRLSAVPTTLCLELSKMRKDFFKKKNRPLVPKLDRGSNNVGYYVHCNVDIAEHSINIIGHMVCTGIK